MAHGMNDDRIICDFVKDYIGVGTRRQPPDRGVIGARADQGVSRQNANERLNAGLNPSRPFG